MNYKIADIKLADAGRLRIDWAEARMPVLMALRKRYSETKPLAGQPTVFNGYRLERGHFVWGLTYRMLTSFFSAIDPGWQPPPEL